MPGNGNGHRRTLEFTQPPQRVVSLVPSLTESMFDLDLGAALVGITDYCIYPPAETSRLPRLGGPKNPDINTIARLQPDLILANQEENTPQAVAALEAQGFKVWVNFPRTVRQAVDVLWLLVGIFRSHAAAQRLETLERALDWAEADAPERPEWRYFCPIWQDAGSAWWMTFNQDTYMNDLLRLFGGVNVFANRQRQYPLEADLGNVASEPPAGRDTRYPRVTQTEILAAAPEVILLPSEPLAFTETHAAEFAIIFTGAPAAQNRRIHCLDGSLLTWHGTRLGKALMMLPDILA